MLVVGICFAFWGCQKDSSSEGEDAAIAFPDAGAPDSSGGADAGQADAEVTTVCTESIPPAPLPSAGLTNVFLMPFVDYGSDPHHQANVEMFLYGSSSVRFPPTTDCWFQVTPGHYTLSVVRDGAEILNQGVDLADGKDEALAVLAFPPNASVVKVVPIDTSAVTEGNWRYVFIDLAQDNLTTMLDIYSYTDVSYDDYSIVKSKISVDEVYVVELAAGTSKFAYLPNGTPPLEGGYSFDISPVNPENEPHAVFVYAIWCDSFLNSSDSPPCSTAVGAGNRLINLDPEP
jgi:hypothetical protein